MRKKNRGPLEAVPGQKVQISFNSDVTRRYLERVDRVHTEERVVEILADLISSTASSAGVQFHLTSGRMIKLALALIVKPVVTA